MKGGEGGDASVRYLQFKVLFHLAHSTLSPGLVCKCVCGVGRRGEVCVLWGGGERCGEVGRGVGRCGKVGRCGREGMHV